MMRLWWSWLFFSWSALGSEFPVWLSIYDFSPYGVWNRASITSFKQNAAGRFELEHVDLVTEGSDYEDCATTILTRVQSPALRAMVETGYLSQAVFDEAHQSPFLWNPDQVRIAVTWSEMTIGQASVLFGSREAIPWGRVFSFGHSRRANSLRDRWWSLPDSTKIMVMRASMMVGVGQVLDPLSGVINHPKLNWQTADVHAGYSDLDRNQFKFIAELGRALVESGPLPGDRNDVVAPLIALLDQDARELGYRREDGIVFARAFDDARILLFQRAFFARPFDAQVKLFFEQDFMRAHGGYLDLIPRRRRSESDAVDAIVFATLSQLYDLYDPSKSESLWGMHTKANGNLTWELAQEVMLAAQSAFQTDFDVRGGEEASGPIRVIDYSNLPRLIAVIQPWLVSNLTESEINAVLGVIGERNPWQNDLFGSHCLEEKYIPLREMKPGTEELTGGHLDQRRPFFGFEISNLNQKMAKQNAYYLAYILTSLYRHYLALFFGGGPLFTSNIGNGLMKTRQRVAELFGDPVPEESDRFTEVDFFSTFPFVVAAHSEWMKEALVQLGGRAFPAKAFRVHFSQKRHQYGVGVDDRDSFLVSFDGEALNALLRQVNQWPPAPEGSAVYVEVGNFQKLKRMRLRSYF